MKNYLYETHLHTSPVSKCAKADVCASLEFYKSLGYAGVFITNHFVGGYINCDKSLPYEEQIEFYYSDYEKGVSIGKELGISVFSGIELPYKDGVDFLAYGLDKKWFLSHPEIMSMNISEKLSLLSDAGALIIHAHPFREIPHIDQIRLFPHCVHGVETYNACRTERENSMAERYAEGYGLISFAGSDNHTADKQSALGGMQSTTPISDEADFVSRVKKGEMTPFRRVVAR